jgi:hypothetical protein
MIFLNHFSFFKIRQVIKDNKYLRIDGFRTMTGQSGATSNKLMGRRPWMLLLWTWLLCFQLSGRFGFWTTNETTRGTRSMLRERTIQATYVLILSSPTIHIHHLVSIIIFFRSIHLSMQWRRINKHIRGGIQYKIVLLIVTVPNSIKMGQQGMTQAIANHTGGSAPCLNGNLLLFLLHLTMQQLR